MNGISAIIATYQRRDHLKKLFDSIVRNNIKNFEAIVVDQNPDDLIIDLIEEYSSSFEIRHLKMQEQNQSKARNIGAAYAKYPVICFPDDDCWYEPDTLQKVLMHFSDKNDTDLLIINWQQHPNQPPVSAVVKKQSLFSFRSVGYGTIVLYFKTEAFLKLGGFLETIGIGKYIGGGEDSELTFRAMNRGLKLYYDRDIKINHLYNPVINRDVSIVRSRQRAMGYLYAKYDVPYWVVLRGLAAPFLKMLVATQSMKRKQLFNMGCARIEGLWYGYNTRQKEVDSTLTKDAKAIAG